jgi:hypothetical protein
METYDELTRLGLYVMPKRRKLKVPMARYWEGGVEAPKITDRNRVIKDQQDYDSSGWCVAAGSRSNRLYVLDFDTHDIEQHGTDPWTLYQWVQSTCETGFVLGSPSGGVHLYYRIPDDKPLPQNISPHKGVDGRGEGGQVVTIGGFNRYDDTADKSKAQDKGVPSGHCDTYRKLEDGDYSFIPEMNDALYAWLTAKTKEKVKPEATEGEQYARTSQGQARIDAHLLQSATEKEKVALECLSFILPNWEDKGYDAWFQLWMSAHHGSGGSAKVRDYIVESPFIRWSDGQEGRIKFRHAWDTYVRQENGYTVASLFYLARQNGWLTRTGYEISDRLVQPINVRYVSEWVEAQPTLPELMLMISQTGSGKTRAIRDVWERLGRPKAVIFVPSVRLATELANTLKYEHGLPVTLYIDNETGKRLQGVQMIDAEILVTTLQTFAMKIYKAGVPMSRYGLVYIEECDQLLQQFSRGGGGMFTSHVNEQEARLGFEVLQEAYRDSKYVWGVDATMSRVSYDVAESLRDKRSVAVIKNEWIEPKAPVTMLEDKAEAMQKILEALEAGKRVVVAADTASDAEEVVSVMTLIGALDGKKSLVITRHTERDPEAIRFMDDVNKHAPEYDLLTYNSAMASGVSITSFAPDVLVQLCRFLTPRVNLQILNRYRKQVQVYCYYRKGENIYGKHAGEILSDAERRALIESGVVNIPLAARSDMAQLRAHITSLAVGDEFQQMRAARDFYRGLLQGDGRRVIAGDNNIVADVIDSGIQAVKEMRRERRDFLARTWPDTPPIDREHPALPEYTEDQVAQGEVHAHIERVLKGNIPEGVDPEHVYEIVQSFSPYVGALAAFADQSGALRRSELFLADRGRALTAITNHITLVRVLASLHNLYSSLEEELTPEKVTERAPVFMKELWALKDEYDSVTSRAEQQFQAVYDRSDNDEDRALDYSKILLKRLGLTQKKQRKGRNGKKQAVYISNIEEAREFLSWRKTELVLTDEPVLLVTTKRQSHMDIYNAMSSIQQAEVMRLLTTERHTDFAVAILHVHSGLDPY